MKKIVSLLMVNCALFIGSAAHAICPICTVAVGAGLEGARQLGVADVIVGIWAGAFALVMIFWTAKFLKRKSVENALWYVFIIATWYSVLALMYLMPGLTYGANRIWGVDQFLLGIIAGSVVFYMAEKKSNKMIRANGGKSRFKFQKVIIPFCSLLGASAIFAAVVYL